MVSVVVRDEIIGWALSPDPPIDDCGGPSIPRDTFHAVSNFINGRFLIPVTRKTCFRGTESMVRGWWMRSERPWNCSFYSIAASVSWDIFASWM